MERRRKVSLARIDHCADAPVIWTGVVWRFCRNSPKPVATPVGVFVLSVMNRLFS